MTQRENDFTPGLIESDLPPKSPQLMLRSVGTGQHDSTQEVFLRKIRYATAIVEFFVPRNISLLSISLERSL
jgi:hypothetical protein